MIKGKKVTAIILAAGDSIRYGKNRNKNFEAINEENTVLSYSLNEFNKNNYIDNIIIATKPNEVENVKQIISRQNLSKQANIVFGGGERKDSVYNAIKETDSDIVIIHDGARPVIRQEYIDKCIESMDEFKGVTMGVKATDTIKIANDNNVVVNSTQRSNTWAIQTPQCFERKTLLKMHEKYKDEEVTDDCMLLEKDNYKIKVIEGDYTNIKITTANDLGVIKGIINKGK